MKKVLSVLFVALLIGGSFSIQSCQKCATCSYTYEGLNGQTESFTYAEICGKSSEVEDYKDACQDAAELVLNGDCTCVDE